MSARDGRGLPELLDALARVAAGRSPADRREGPARLPVDRVFALKGIGTVVTGTLWRGAVRAGDRLVVQPGRRDRDRAQRADARPRRRGRPRRAPRGAQPARRRPRDLERGAVPGGPGAAAARRRRRARSPPPCGWSPGRAPAQDGRARAPAPRHRPARRASELPRPPRARARRRGGGDRAARRRPGRRRAARSLHPALAVARPDHRRRRRARRRRRGAGASAPAQLAFAAARRGRRRAAGLPAGARPTAARPAWPPPTWPPPASSPQRPRRRWRRSSPRASSRPRRGPLGRRAGPAGRPAAGAAPVAGRAAAAAERRSLWPVP